jgi:hypothetical protein
VRANELYRLPPGLLASDLRPGKGAPDDQTPAAAWRAPSGALLLGKGLAAAASGRRSSAAAGEGGSSGGSPGGMLGARGRALLGRLSSVRRNV